MKVILIILISWLVLNLLIWSIVKPTYVRHNAIRIMLGEIHDACAQHNIRYWVCGGTMLGAYRDGNIIAWDDDADICIDERDVSTWTTLVRETLKGKGVTSCDEFKLSPVDGRVYLQEDTTSAFVDVFYCRTNTDGQSVFANPRANFLYGKKDWVNEEHIREEMLAEYPLGTYVRDNEAYRLVVRGTADPEMYLVRKFGPSWYVPVMTHFHSLNAYMEHIACPTLVIVSLLLILVGALVHRGEKK
jgi:hypothetical protein